MKRVAVELLVLVLVLAMVVLIPPLSGTSGPSVLTVVLLGAGWVLVRLVFHAAQRRRQPRDHLTG